MSTYPSLSENSQPFQTTPQPHAPLQEIFSSIQGEGIYVGKRQIFVRFAHCHLKCAYCDTPMTSPSGKCQVEIAPGSSRYEHMENPVSVDAALLEIRALYSQAKHHSISFTGGEPLLYHRFLSALLPEVRTFTKTYLETSGTQPDFLETVLPWSDIIAMDIKLPSATQESPHWEEHAAFYQTARTQPETTLFIKLVFQADTSEDELKAVEEIVTDRHIPIILQPVTSLADKQVHLSPQEIFRVEHRLSQTFHDVRVIPQTHKMLNIL